MPNGARWRVMPRNGSRIMKTIKNSSSFALVSYISRCYHDSDWIALNTLSINRAQAHRVSQLSAYESNILSSVIGRSAVFKLHFACLRRCHRFVLEDPVTLSGATSKTKEVDLCLHVFNYVITLYRGNRKQELRDIGLQPMQAEFISQLPWLELQKLARYLWFFATVRFDTKRLNRLVDTAVASARWIGQCSELIRADAPRDLMIRYYGMSCELYAEARDMHGRQCRGRPRVLPDDLQDLLYEEFMRRYQSYGEGVDPLCQPKFFLEIYESLGRKVSLREIWILVQEWMKRRLVSRRSGNPSVKWPDPDQGDVLSVPRMAPRLRSRARICRPPSSTASELSRPSSSAILSSCDRAEMSG